MNNNLKKSQYRFQNLENKVGSGRKRDNIKKELDDANSKLKAVTLDLQEARQDIHKLQKAGKKNEKITVAVIDDLHQTTNKLKKTKDKKGLLAKDIQNYQAKLNNINSNSTLAQKDIDKLELSHCELEVEKTDLQNHVTEYKYLKEVANQHKMKLISKLKSKNYIIRSLKDVNMDSWKENLELCLGELKKKIPICKILLLNTKRITSL